MHVRMGDGTEYTPLEVSASVPVEFETENFQGRCLFLHRPDWSFDNNSSMPYPYRQHFHGRKRLWEWRLQGKFKRRPGVLYSGIELEEYVAVTWGTRALMKGLLPLIQRALGCKQVHHEIGNEKDSELRPVVVAPIWAADNTLVHSDAADVPALQTQTLPTGLGRKAARQYWESLWAGGGPTWEDGHGGPTYTFAVWGPSPLMDLQAWVFRKLPLTWGRDLPMDPFCGRQPVHAVVYELEEGVQQHRQEHKKYVWDVRFMPKSVWTSFAMGDSTVSRVTLTEQNLEAMAERAERAESDLSREESFCSALSHNSADSGNSTEELLTEKERLPDMEDYMRSPSSQLPQPLMARSSERRGGMFTCCRRRRRPRWDLLNA